MLRSTFHSHIVRNGGRSFSVVSSEEEQLRQQAKALTLKLYRACIRSIRHIRYGNEVDEAEFQRREKERLDMLSSPSSSSSTRSTIKSNSMLSILPPVDRNDELRSRAEYYLQYARDYFLQEAGCLEGELHKQRVARYVYNLHRGEHQRKWLLKDMGFDDPFVGVDEIQVELFQTHAQVLAAARYDNAAVAGSSSTSVEKDDDDSNKDAYAWSDDEEEESHLPGWYKNAKSGGSV